MDRCELPLLHEKALVNLKDVDFCMKSTTQFHIPQVDGLDNISLVKKCFSVNCEIEELIALVTFFRSFENLWNCSTQHDICDYIRNGANCFFCLMRSGCVRINSPRATGPKSLKMVEFVSQLSKFQEVLQWDWRVDKNDMAAFIENTIKLLILSEKLVFDKFIIQQQCKQCESCQGLSEKLVIELLLEPLEEKVLTMQEVLSLLFQKLCNSCLETLTSKSKTGFVILKFARLVNVHISNNVYFKQQTIKYMSHISEEIYIGLTGKFERNFYFTKGFCLLGNFTLGEEIYYQDVDRNICSDSYGNKRNVRYLALSFGLDMGSADSSFIYGQKQLRNLDKQYMQTINPEKHQKSIEKQREYDRKRDQTEERKKREQTEKRKEREKTENRKKREHTEERKNMHKAIDAKRDQTPN